jgi:hypothetical protein
MINGKLQEFVCDVIAKGQIGYGDVRRLQRDYLPDGITNREELELLICLNARLVRVDKAWAQWLVASVVEFVAKREVREQSMKEDAVEWVRRLRAASTTSLGRRIARQIRRELGGRHGIQSTNSDERHLEGGIQLPPQTGAPENDPDDCRLRMAKPPRRDPDKSRVRSRPHRRTVRHQKIPGVTTLVGAAHGGCPAGHLSVFQRGHLINFQRVSLVLAPCR